MKNSQDHLLLEELETLVAESSASNELNHHLEYCAQCRALFETWTKLKSSVVKHDGVSMTRRVRQGMRRRTLKLWLTRSAVAVMVLGMGVGIYVQYYTRFSPSLTPSEAITQVTSAEQESIQKSLHWLASVRESDGHWSAQRWGGLARFDVAVTALALMPLLEDEKSMTRSDLRQSVEYLKAQQRQDGGFGPAFMGDLYNHCMSTIVLLKVQKKYPQEVPESMINAALRYLNKHQNPEGGYAYRDGLASELALSLWARDVLVLVDHADVEAEREQLSQWMHNQNSSLAHASDTFASVSAGQWMTRYAQSQGPAPQDLQGASLPKDIYQAYYCYRSLSSLKNEPSKKLLAQLQNQLLSQQELQGEYAGSWAADGQWGRVGGRVYNTGVALMCLMERLKS